MQAFHNSPEIKREYIARMRHHMEMDELIRGTYWDIFNLKGCAVGCTVKLKVGMDRIHDQLEQELDIPVSLFHLEDKLFEITPESYYPTFPLKFLEAIPVGADCSLVPNQFLHWLLVDLKYGVIQYAEETGKEAIQRVADLHLRAIEGGTVDVDEWADADTVLFNLSGTDNEHACVAARHASQFYLFIHSLNEATDAMVDTILELWQEDTRSMDREEVRRVQAEYLLKLLREAPVA